MFVSFLIQLFLTESFSFAGPIDDLVNALKDSGEKFEIVGTICEQAARLDLEREYLAPRFTVETGISYGNQNRTIGELDVIVFDSSRNALVVAEVKCWKDLGGAIRKARDQRQRFQNTIAQSDPRVRLQDRQHLYHRLSDFMNVSSFLSISQSGGRTFGFDREISLSLDELMEARQRLMQCQRSGACRRPSY